MSHLCDSLGQGDSLVRTVFQHDGMSHLCDSLGQGDSLVKTVFQHDPKLIEDLRNHRSHDSYKLIKRLEAVKKRLNSTANPDKDDSITTLLNTLVSVYIQTADSIKISRAVEKLWQPYLSGNSEHIYAVLEDHVLAMIRSDQTDGHSVAKVLFEQNKIAQKVVKQNLAVVMGWIADRLSVLTELSPSLLSQTQARCLYSFVKISLQLFQICPLELAPAIWSQEPVAAEYQASLGHGEQQASKGLRSDSVRVVVENLVHILSVKGYHLDCVLLSGTAVALMLNTAPDPETAVHCFKRLLHVILNEDSRFSLEFFGNPPDQSGVGNMSDQLNHLDRVNIETVGSAALIRGVVVCANTEFLCCELEESSCEKSECGGAQDNSIKIPRETASTLVRVHTLYRLFKYIHKMCQGDITLHYHAFHILLLWYSRVIKFTSTQESSFVQAYASSVLESTLELVMLNWDSPVEDVPEIVVDIFSNMMSLWAKVKDTMPEFSTDILVVLLKSGWHVKGKYRIMAVLLKYLDTQQVSQVCSGIQPQLLKCLATNHLAPSASAVYKAFLTDLGSNSSDALDRWRSVWLQTVETGLISENTLLRHNTGLHWVPATLRLLPSSASVLQEHLSGRLDRADTSVTHTRLLHAWVVVASAIRNITGTADLTGPQIKEALYSLDDDIRSWTIALICTTLKKAECLSATEAGLLMEVLPYNIKIDSAPFRQLLGSSLRKLLVRLRDSCITMLKAPAENKLKLDCALDFVDWLHSLCMGNLMPGSCYQRRKGSLDLLHMIYECLVFSPDSRQRKGFTPETAVKLMDWAVSTGRWSFFSRQNIDTLLLCLLDGADEIQMSSFDLLSRHHLWPPDENVETPDSLCCHLVSAATQLCNSPKGHESQSGAVLCKLAFQKYVLVRKADIKFSDIGGHGRYKVTASCSDGDAASEFLRSVLEEVHKSLAMAEGNLVVASKKYPIHGLVAALCQCMTECEDLWSGSHTEAVTVGQEFIATCQNIIENMMAVMSSVAGQEACPSFAEIGVALENLILEHQPEYTESTALSPEYQYMLSWCWNNIKESCVSLGEMMWAMVINQVPVPLSMVKSISSTFLSVLTKCRHKGVIEGCRSSFIQFCSALFKSEDDSLHKITEETLNQVLSSLKSKEIKSSVTRRSAGLPIILQAILTSEKKLKKKALLTLAVSELFEVCELPLDDDYGVTDLPQVHGLNILNSLFSDTSLTASLMGHMSRAVVLVIHQFGSPSWAVRNAATRFFSTLVTRIFGQKKTGGNDDTMLCNSLTFLEFSSYYPELPPFLLGILREASVKDIENIAEIHPSLFPVLTLLSFLKPVDKKSDGLKRTLMEFGDQIKMFVHSPVYQLRHLVAPAFVAMVNMADLMTTTVSIIHKYMPKDFNPENITLNCIHGNMLVVNKLLDNLTDQGDLETVWTLVMERLWLLSVHHGMVSSLYVRLLHRLLQKHGHLQMETRVVDEIVDICCHGNAVVGDGIFKSEIVELLFHVVVEKDTEKDLSDFIGKLLMSECLETRKACLLKLESELCSWKPDLLRILCKNLENEAYAPNICVMLNMISKLYLEFRIILPDDIDHIRDWFQNCLPVQRKCLSLLAASIPVQGILIKSICHGGTREHEVMICQWCQAVMDSSKATNETQRHAAAVALQVVDDCVFQAGKDGNTDLSDCVVSLMSACLTLIQDEDTGIRAEACKFVSSLQWTERLVQYQCVHSNVCFELFLHYIATQFWQFPKCVRLLCGQLYCQGNLSTVLQDKAATRFQQLFDQEDNSFFAERLYNGISYHHALKEMVARCRLAGMDTVKEVILELNKIEQDIDMLNETLQSFRSGSIINICCDNAVLASICGLLLMSDLVAMVTCESDKQTIRSKVKDIFQEQKLPPGVKIAVGKAFGFICIT